MLHRNAKVDLIKQAPLFARCTKKEIEQVAQLADEIDLREGPPTCGGKAAGSTR